MLFIILIAVALIGSLTAAIMSTSDPESANIDDETLVLRASEIQRHASEVERAVLYIMQDGKSEADLRFAHPDAHADYGDWSADPDLTDQVFHPDGGAATYRNPPNGIQTSTGGDWEFYGATDLPGVGSDRPDLIALLPNVTQQFCDAINKINNQSGTPTDTGSGSVSGTTAADCIYQGDAGRFDDTQQFFDVTPNTTDETTFAQDPEISQPLTATQACVRCASTGANHVYHVLMSR
jgi:hypothetical protein